MHHKLTGAGERGHRPRRTRQAKRPWVSTNILLRLDVLLKFSFKLVLASVFFLKLYGIYYDFDSDPVV